MFKPGVGSAPVCLFAGTATKRQHLKQKVLTSPGLLTKRVFPRGDVAQLGERLNGIQEAVSSILSISTRNFGLAARTSPFFVPEDLFPKLSEKGLHSTI